jgi:glutamyl-tRNA reductase
MKVVLVGLSHKTAPVEIRERHAVLPEDCAASNEKLLQTPELDEVAILSTCNRTELVSVAPEPDAAALRLHTFLREEIGDGSLRPEHCYERRGPEAVAHVIRVGGSLDSMVLGEAQILGQIKQAYRSAVCARSIGPVLHRLFQRTFRAAKRMRSQTGLGGSSVSVARVGVQLAREIFESFAHKQVLLVGAGEMAESALHGLQDAGARSVVVLNRSLERAQSLASQVGGRAVPFANLTEELEAADIALASVQVTDPVISPDDLRGVMHRRHGRPLLLIDLGLPRNVDGAVNDLENVYLYDLDDLEEVAERGLASRQAAVAPAEEIVAAEVERFERWCTRLEVTPTIKELIERVGSVARTEAQRRASGRSDEFATDLERAAESIVAKLLHRPMERLRAEAEEGGGAYYAEAIRDLFGLDGRNPSEDDDS